MKKDKKCNLNNEKNCQNPCNNETIILSNQERDLILKTLGNPPDPNLALKKLLEKESIETVRMAVNPE